MGVHFTSPVGVRAAGLALTRCARKHRRCLSGPSNCGFGMSASVADLCSLVFTIGDPGCQLVVGRACRGIGDDCHHGPSHQRRWVR